MKRQVKKIAATPQMPKAIRVAAYARVSSGKDAMLHSLAAQVEHYRNYIQHHSGWEFAGVYADEAKTGTKANREQFQRMLADCKAGKINRIITKSISRFARNTVTLLETVRELKTLGVSVYFEEQAIDTASADGELMLTILASFAQEESLSVSENQKWRVKRNFEQGKPWNGTVLGYRIVDGKYEIVPKEADIVKSIFADYLAGKGTLGIAKDLNEVGIATRRGNAWTASCVRKVLCNYSYTGNLLLQTTYSDNHLTKQRMSNQGELPMYHAANTHDAIIPMETFEAVQAEMAIRREKHTNPQPKKAYPLTGKITCAICGKRFRRKTTASRIDWVCSTYNTYGKAHCASKAIPETTLMELIEQIGGLDKITEITAAPDNTVVFTLPNGETTVKRWQNRSRSESWTPEMRQAARERRERHGNI